MKFFSNNLFRDVRFWILFAFVIRLFAITNPPLEVAHNWRQTNVTMVARNFYEVDNNIFYPRIDCAGNKTGITGMEFPLLNYLIYLMALIFGYAHWYGRLINLVVTGFGVLFFYKSVKIYFAEKTAFNASIILLFSVWFMYARKIMPDTFSVSLVFIGIYYAIRYFKGKPGFFNLTLYLLFMLMGVLSKLPAGYLLVILPLIAYYEHVKRKRIIIFIATSVVFLIPVYVWYFIWVPYLVSNYHLWYFFMGKGFGKGFHEIVQYLPQTLEKFYFTSLHFIGFACFLIGLIVAIMRRDKVLLFLTGATFLSFLIVVLKGGTTFSHHAYYIIPFTPIMAIVAGYGIDKINYKKLSVILLLATCIEGVANQFQDFSIKDKSLALLKLESDLNTCSKKKDLIAINSGDYPTPLYFAHRKGWVKSNGQ